MKYAIQRKDDGDLVEVIEVASLDENPFKEFKYLEAFPITEGTHKVLVQYVEFGGPWGYGHSEPSYTSYYSNPRIMVSNVLKWIKETAEVFGPDKRDIQDFFKYCTMYIDGERKDWFERKARKFYVNEKEDYGSDFVFPE